MKRCACGASYTPSEWRELLLVGYQDEVGDEEAGDPPMRLEFRNCVCGSTIAIDLLTDIGELRPIVSQVVKDEDDVYQAMVNGFVIGAFDSERSAQLAIEAYYA